MSRYSERRGRDDDDDRSRDRGRGRDDDDRGGRRSRDDDDRGGRRGGGRSYEYQARSDEQGRKRAEQRGGDFDSYLGDRIKLFKVNDGNNTVRILPPTWPKPDHYGYDIYVHYAVGPDRQTYLCNNKMKGEKCPICEERAQAQRDGDEKYAKKLEPRKRVLVYVVDRDHEKNGVMAWAMPWTLDRDIMKVSTDRKTGGVLQIDNPQTGYDVEFEKQGSKDRTEYLGVQIARRDSDLGDDRWLDFAVDNPLPDQLVFYDYDHIAKAFGAGPAPDDDDDDRGRDRGGRDDRGGSRRRSGDDDDDRGGRRSRDDDRGGSSRRREPDYSYDDIVAMKPKELDALAEELGVDIRRCNDDDEVVKAICEHLRLEPSKPRREPERDRDEGRRSGDDDDEPRTRRRSGDDDDAPKTRSRGDDDDPPRRHSSGDDDERMERMRDRRRD